MHQPNRSQYRPHKRANVQTPKPHTRSTWRFQRHRKGFQNTPRAANTHTRQTKRQQRHPDAKWTEILITHKQPQWQTRQQSNWHNVPRPTTKHMHADAKWPDPLNTLAVNKHTNKTPWSQQPSSCRKHQYAAEHVTHTQALPIQRKDSAVWTTRLLCRLTANNW
jgi:hypothetical protein